MHGVRSVKGKAKSAEQFRLECVYADVHPCLSLFLFLARTRALSFPFSLPLSLQYSHSYYFSSVLVTIGICQRRKRALKEGKINRESSCEAETASRKREVQEKREKENGQDDTGGRVLTYEMLSKDERAFTNPPLLRYTTDNLLNVNQREVRSESSPKIMTLLQRSL
ncbi:hypothetical protein ACFW04_000632 [Cataglyphis niger]